MIDGKEVNDGMDFDGTEETYARFMGYHEKKRNSLMGNHGPGKASEELGH